MGGDRAYILEKEMATHSSILAWKIPWMEDPVRLQSMGLQRVGYDCTTSLHFTSCLYTVYLDLDRIDLNPIFSRIYLNDSRICLQCRRPQFYSWVGKFPWTRDRIPTLVFLGFSYDSAGKESTCNVGDVGSIPEIPWRK